MEKTAILQVGSPGLILPVLAVIWGPILLVIVLVLEVFWRSILWNTLCTYLKYLGTLHCSYIRWLLPVFRHLFSTAYTFNTREYHGISHCEVQ